MRTLALVLTLTLAAIAAAQSQPQPITIEATIELPGGVRLNSIDLGPSGTVGVYHLGGGNFQVVEGRDTYDHISGGMVDPKSGATAQLECWAKKPCPVLWPGTYKAQFLIKRTPWNTLCDEQFAAEPKVRPDGTLGPDKSHEVLTRLMDSVSVDYRKLDKHGQPKGKELTAVYSIEWMQPIEADKMRDRFIAAHAVASTGGQQ